MQEISRYDNEIFIKGEFCWCPVLSDIYVIAFDVRFMYLGINSIQMWRIHNVICEVRLFLAAYTFGVVPMTLFCYFDGFKNVWATYLAD